MSEIWKDIKGFEGYYQVSNQGQVKALERTVLSNNANHPTNHLKEHILSVNKTAIYYSVALCKDGKLSRRTVHRLVAETFIPNSDNLPCINHKDHNTHNNNVDNLEWCTYKYNNEYDDRVDKCKAKISKTLKGRPGHHPTDIQRKHISESAKKAWAKRKAKSH